MSCSKCGSAGFHACPGSTIPPWTEEAKAELKKVLERYASSETKEVKEDQSDA